MTSYGRDSMLSFSMMVFMKCNKSVYYMANAMIMSVVEADTDLNQNFQGSTA